jgi:hypothetical protein
MVMTQLHPATFCDGKFVPDEPMQFAEGQKAIVVIAPDLKTAQEIYEQIDPALIARLARFNAAVLQQGKVKTE